MQHIEIDPFISFTLAIVLLFVGKLATMHCSLLQKYSIPEPVIGGFICALFVAVVYWGV